MRLDDFAGRDFAVRGFVEVALIKADLPKDRSCPKRPILSGKSYLIRKGGGVLGLKGGVMRAQNSNTRRKTAVKRDEVGRGSRLYKADIAKK